MGQIDKDLSTITTISLNSTQKFLDRFQDCICYSLQEQLKQNEEYIELDIYIGTLILVNRDDDIEFKFIPSNKFESDIISTYNNKECPLIHKLEDSLTTKIKAAYKEFL